MALYQGQKNKLWVWKAFCRDTGRLIDWELGNRDAETLKLLIDRLSEWNVTVFCTDDWQPYEKELGNHPTAHLVQSKSETVAIERNNSDTRHWLGRFHRKSKIISRCTKMVDL